MKRRKIPGRKHHGVKDPEKQQAERLKKIKDKINTPPTDPEDQQIPKSLQRFAELTARVKNGEFDNKRRKRQKKSVQNHAFQQLPHETDRHFLYRVHKHCEQVKHEAAFAEKFKVDIKRNENGEIESVQKRAKDPLEVMMKEVKQEKKNKKNAKKKKKAEENGEERLSKSQKRKLKLSERKNSKDEKKIDEFDKYVDRVQFGEQAHAPPTLTAPKKAPPAGAPRPGRKDLLLKSIMEKNKTENNVIDRTGKRKTLPNALRRQLDRQQEEVIKAYKLLKAQKLQKNV